MSGHDALPTHEQFPSPAAVFAQALQEGRFIFQKARISGRCFFFPRLAEPGSGAVDFDWVEASGDGHVYAVPKAVRAICIAVSPRPGARGVGAMRVSRVGYKSRWRTASRSVRARSETG